MREDRCFTKTSGRWLLLCGCVLLGCGKSDGVLVTGTASYDGAPLQEGAISFISTDGSLTSAGALIRDGKFSAQVAPGAKRVEIRASRPIAQRKDDPESACFREDFLPAKFNSASTLTADISADQKNVLSFDLTSK